ncbi:MAG: hypothetical protein ACFNP5_08045 [Hoylesella saccharolytica]
MKNTSIAKCMCDNSPFSPSSQMRIERAKANGSYLTNIKHRFLSHEWGRTESLRSTTKLPANSYWLTVNRWLIMGFFLPPRSILGQISVG